MKQITVTVQIPEDKIVRPTSIEESINTIAKLPYEDLDRLIQIAKNPKALKALKDKWFFLKSMF